MAVAFLGDAGTGPALAQRQAQKETNEYYDMKNIVWKKDSTDTFTWEGKEFILLRNQSGIPKKEQITTALGVVTKNEEGEVKYVTINFEKLGPKHFFPTR